MNTQVPGADPSARQRIRDLVAIAERQTEGVEHVAPSAAAGRRPAAESPPIPGVEALLARELPGYQILGEVHRGGQGVVFRAIQRSTRRQVALKVLREGPFATAAERTRFEREVQALAQLRHSEIVAIHDSGQAAGHFYLVTDFIEGLPLDAHVAAEGRGVRATLRLYARVCDAVHAAHLRGVIHRDLKPGNVLVDAEGAPRVLDFGLAKFHEPPPSSAAGLPAAQAAAACSSSDGAAEHSLTLAGQFVGSLPWCSPEQAEGAAVDIRTDVYSLGVMLYQVLTARFPYRVTGAADEILAAVRTQAPLRPRAARRELDDEVETILLKCLQKEPARRYQSAGELARDLRHYLAGEPIEAKRDSAAYVVRKALRRHWLGSSVAAAFLALAAVALPTFAALWQSAGRERDRALAAEAEQRREREVAEREASKARAVTAFLRDMLSSADPQVAQGREITVHEVLAAAQRELDGGSLAAEPDVAAAVRATLGRTYLSISKHVEAGAQLEAASATIESRHGPDCPDLIDPLIDLARVLRNQGRLEESESLARRALEIAESSYGPQSADVAPALATLAFTILERGRRDEPASLLRRRLTVLRAALGDEHPEVAIATADLAQCVHDATETESLLEQAAEIASRSLAPDNPRLIRIFRARAHSQLMRRAYPEAETSFLEGLRRARAVFGPRSAEVYALLADLAMLYEFAGRTDEQIQTLDESIDVARAIYGADNLEIARRRLDLCVGLTRAGLVDDADREAREALAILQRIGDPDRRLGAIVRDSIADLALRREDWDLAEQMAHEILEVDAETLAPYTWPHAAARGVLGAVHAARGEYEQAEALLVAACEEMGRGPLIRGHRRAAIQRLVQLYETRGEPEAAQRWKAELAESSP